MKIIWLKTGPLHPLDTGGKIRTYHMLRELKRWHELIYVSLCAETCGPQVIETAAEYSGRQVWIPWQEARKGSIAFYGELALNLFSTLPYAIAKYRSEEMTRRIQALEATSRPDLIVCDFLFPSVNLFANNLPRTKTLLFQHNIESMIWKRLYQQAASAPKRAYFHGQWRRMEKFERHMCARFDGIAGVSNEDCDMMRRDCGAQNVLGAVPTGVDCEFFRAKEARRTLPSLVFLGSMDWLPNIDAVGFFVNEIWPAIKQRFPEAALTIVGRNPPPQVRSLEKRAMGVHVTGTVDDVRPFLAEAAVMVVPLRVGGGTRIKIFEAAAAGVPVVSTSIGIEGLPLTHRENVLVANTPVDFAEATMEMLGNPEFAGRIAGNACRLVREHFNWEAVAHVFSEYCNHVVQP